MLELMNELNESVGKELLDALISEMAQQQKPWQQLSEIDQKMAIYRLRERIKDQLRGALTRIASDDHPVLPSVIKKVERGDEIKVQLTLSPMDPHRHELTDRVNSTCMILLVDSADYTKGMDDVKPEPDQRALDLGHEYKDED